MTAVASFPVLVEGPHPCKAIAESAPATATVIARQILFDPTSSLLNPNPHSCVCSPYPSATPMEGVARHKLLKKFAFVPCHPLRIRKVVPDEGIEPPTFGLQNRCSTAELIRRRQAILAARE